MKPKRKESGCQNLKSPAQTDSAVFWEGSRKETVTAEWTFKGKEILNQEWQPAANGFISAGNRPFGHCRLGGWKLLKFSLSIPIFIVQSNLAIRNVFIRNKLVLRNHFLWPICHLLHKDKELLALRNNFRTTKKFRIAKFDCTCRKKSWNHLKRTYFWRVLALGSHCGSIGSRGAPHTALRRAIICSCGRQQRTALHCILLHGKKKWGHISSQLCMPVFTLQSTA